MVSTVHARLLRLAAYGVRGEMGDFDPSHLQAARLTLGSLTITDALGCTRCATLRFEGGLQRGSLAARLWTRRFADLSSRSALLISIEFSQVSRHVRGVQPRPGRAEWTKGVKILNIPTRLLSVRADPVNAERTRLSVLSLCFCLS